MYHIKEAAQLSGVSVKTLYHYDKIGLLVPLKSENGYRTYSQEDLERLQVILYYKYLGFSLEKIAELLKEDTTVGLFNPGEATSGYLNFNLTKNHSRTKRRNKNDHSRKIHWI